MRATGLVLGAALLFAAPHAVGADLRLSEVVSELELPVDLVGAELPLGGLSGLTYDPACALFYAVSDDRGDIAPPRVHVLGFEPEGVGVRSFDVITLRDRDGRPFARGLLDAEAVSLAPDGTLWVATEGVSHLGVPPRIIAFRLDGTLIDELEVPPAYLPGEGVGVRSNNGFEGMSVTPDGDRIVAAVESALVQDGPAADLDRGTVVRLVVFDVKSARAIAERAYAVEPVPDEPDPPTAYRSIGVSEVLALGGGRVLVVERSFSAGIGNRVRLFLADLGTGDDVTGIATLPPETRPVDKVLVADLADLGIDPDNLEGMTLGPVLPDGRQSLVFIADNNFHPSVQRNQLLVLAVDGVAGIKRPRPRASIAQIQGADHTSPLVGRCVRDVGGTVTAILGQRRGQAFWVQSSGDGDPATSDGLFVTVADGLPQVAVGDAVRLGGRVEEPAWGMELPVTRLRADGLEITGWERELPPPVVLGAAGRRIPSPNIDDDGLTRFEPETDAIDFFESLEGMRVRVDDPVVVGPTSGHGEIVVLGDGGAGVEPRSGRGGVVLRPDNAHPERIIIDDRLVTEVPNAAVGDALVGPIDGVLHYSYGSFKLLDTAPLELEAREIREPEATALVADRDHVTIAAFNVENLSAVSPPQKFAAVASAVVGGLASPTVLAVEEIQDDSGPEDDGIVGAEATLAALTDAIVAAGGPRYSWAQVDPVNNADGGRPGANIRVALLFDGTRAVPAGQPEVIGSGDPAFAESRKPLVVELEIDGRLVVLVVCHLRSKGGDDPLFGRRQPPVRESERQRVPQARTVRAAVDRLLARDPGARVVVLGDLNDFEFSQAVGILAAPPMVNLVGRLDETERSTYVYQGNSQTLDHIIVSPVLAAGAEVEVLHLNSDLPAATRASDHDPVLTRFSIVD